MSHKVESEVEFAPAGPTWVSGGGRHGSSVGKPAGGTVECREVYGMHDEVAGQR
jgi:hypothetical protein